MVKINIGKFLSGLKNIYDECNKFSFFQNRHITLCSWLHFVPPIFLLRKNSVNTDPLFTISDFNEKE